MTRAYTVLSNLGGASFAVGGTTPSGSPFSGIVEQICIMPNGLCRVTIRKGGKIGLTLFHHYMTEWSGTDAA